MEYTREQLLNYLKDCYGHPVETLNDWTDKELCGLAKELDEAHADENQNGELTLENFYK